MNENVNDDIENPDGNDGILDFLSAILTNEVSDEKVLTRDGWRNTEPAPEVRHSCNALASFYAGLRQEGFSNEESFTLLIAMLQAQGR